MLVEQRRRVGADGDLMALYSAMLRVRRFEEKVRDLRMADEIAGSVHLAIGQEAIYVGVCAAISDDDVVFSTYRGHGWAAACGVPLEPMFAEFLGRRSGVNGGRGGSAYFSAADYNFYGENSIVGGGLPIAVGAALAAKFDGSGRVAVVGFGDGAMNQGSAHEAMNFAAAMSLPVLFVLENNLYSELTPISDMVKTDRLYERAAAYGMPGTRLDGNDPVEVRDRALEALERARRGDGPTLLECMTERLVGHYIGDAELYRAPGEVEAAKTREPLVVARAELLRTGATLGDIEKVESAVELEVASAASSALAQPPADPTTVKEHLYV